MADTIRPYSQVDYLVADRIATITLSRPDKLNAFTQVMRDELIDAFDRADSDDECGQWLSLAGDERLRRRRPFGRHRHIDADRRQRSGRPPRPSTACRGTVAVR